MIPGSMWTRRDGQRAVLRLTLAAAFTAPLAGCSLQKLAVNAVGSSLAKGGSVYARDDDPDLVGEALPFGLKTIETLLESSPRHRGLLVAAASGFTQYANAYVDLEALELQFTDVDSARVLRRRAKRLYLRGREYGFRALELRNEDFRGQIASDPAAALAPFRREHVPELYWTAAAWVSAIAADKNDLDLVADLGLIEPMIARCLELDENYDAGALHEFMILFEGERSSEQGGSIQEAQEHFRRATELAQGRKVGPLVGLAETVAVRSQDGPRFRTLLEEALAFDADSAPEYRLANLLAQRRARILLAHTEDMILDPLE